MHLILTGATGLVGSAALRAMLVNPNVSKISILSRRPVPQAEGQEKANVIIHKDFNIYDPSLAEKLSGADGCVWALGISQNLVSKDEYVQITQSYPIAFTKFLSTFPTPTTFVYVSGEGVTHNAGRFTPIFSRIKGLTELALLSASTPLPGPTSVPVYIVRPAAVDPSAHPEIHPYIPTPGALIRVVQGPLMAGIRLAVKSQHTPTKELGEVLVDVAMRKGEPLSGEGVEYEGRILRNAGVRRMGGLS